MIALSIALVLLGACLVLAARVLAVGLMHAMQTLTASISSTFDLNASVEHTVRTATLDSVHDMVGAWVAVSAKHGAQLVRLAQLGVTDIPKATPITGTPDAETEARAAMRANAIERGAIDLQQKAAMIGASLSPDAARAQAAKLIDSITAPA